MASTFGLGPAGFIPKQQRQIVAELQAAHRAKFGNTINLGDQSLFGQLIAIYSEREALLWQLSEAVYQGQWPQGAEGINVDNLLALTGLRRLPAAPTTTNPNPVTQSNGLTLYGLLLRGTAGTIVPKGSIITSRTTPPHNFALDADATIIAASNAQQKLTLGTAPVSGTYTLSLTSPTGVKMLTPPIDSQARGNVTRLVWPRGVPSSGQFTVMYDDQLTVVPVSSLPTLKNALNAYLNGTTVDGVSVTNGYDLTFSGYAPSLDVNPYFITFGSPLPGASFGLVIGGVSTTAIPYTAIDATMAAAIKTAIDNTGARCHVKPVGTTGFAISFLGYPRPSLFLSDATGITVAYTDLNQYQPNVINCVQSAVNVVRDASNTGAARPFADAKVTQAGQTFTIDFGGNPRPLGQTKGSDALAVPATQVSNNSLLASGLFVSAVVAVTAAGNPAQVAATATCTETGPIEVVAGQLAVVGTPVSGWSSVTNDLDCLTGRNVESDTDALKRRQTRLAVTASSPLQGIVDKVANLPGVTSVGAYENTSQAALQTLTFSAAPNPGSTFQLVLQGGTTAPIPAPDITALSLQSAIAVLPGYAPVVVTGNLSFGFSIDFAGSQGGQAQQLLKVSNAANVGVGINIAFGRAPNSFEIVVDGGLSSQIARAIFEGKPGGITAYGSPTAITYGDVNQGSAQVVVQSAAGISPGLAVVGYGIPAGVQVISISGTTVTLSAAALGNYSGVTLVFSAGSTILDTEGNPHIIGFTRPRSLLVYVNVSLVTDQYRVPGNPASGINGLARWNPSRLQDVQQAIVDVGNNIGVGGVIVGTGSDGLVGSFNRTTGVVGYTLTFGLSPNPTNTQPIQMLPTQRPLFNLGSVNVAFT